MTTKICRFLGSQVNVERRRRWPMRGPVAVPHCQFALSLFIYLIFYSTNAPPALEDASMAAVLRTSYTRPRIVLRPIKLQATSGIDAQAGPGPLLDAPSIYGYFGW